MQSLGTKPPHLQRWWNHCKLQTCSHTHSSGCSLNISVWIAGLELMFSSQEDNQIFTVFMHKTCTISLQIPKISKRSSPNSHFCPTMCMLINPNTIKSYKILQKLSPKHAAHGVAQPPYPIYRHGKACLNSPPGVQPRTLAAGPGFEPRAWRARFFSPPSFPSSFGNSFIGTFPTKPTKVLGLYVCGRGRADRRGRGEFWEAKKKMVDFYLKIDTFYHDLMFW